MHSGNIIWESQSFHDDKLGPIIKAAFSPISHMLVCCHEESTLISVWSTTNAKTWSLKRRIDNGSAVHCLSFSKDGSLLATGSKDGLLCIWDVQTWTLKQDPVAGHEGPISCIAFSSNCMQIATGSSDKMVRLWNAETGESIGNSMAGHRDIVRVLAWSTDGSTLASGSSDGSIILWNTLTFSMRGISLKHNGGCIIFLAFTNADDQESFLLSLNTYSDLLQWDTVTGTVLRILLDGTTVPSMVTDFCLTPDGTHGIIASGETVTIVDISLDTANNPSASKQQQQVHSVEFSPDNSIIASVENSNCINLWTQDGEPLDKLLMSDYSTAVFTRFSHDGQLLASGDNEGVIRIWNTGNWRMVHEFLTHGHPVVAAWSLNGSQLAVGAIGNELSLLVCLWDPHTGQLLGQPIEDTTHKFHRMAFSANGRTIAAASKDDFTVRLWDVETGAQIGMPLTGHTDWIRGIAFSPDGSKLVTGGNDKCVRVWDVKTGRRLFSPIIHARWVLSVAFSPDGKMVYSACNDQCIRAFDSNMGSSMGRPLKGHTDRIRRIAISPDGRHIVSGGRGGTIRVWDSHTFSWDEVPLKSGLRCGLRGPDRVPESIDEDGWIRTPEGKLVLWVPTQYRKRVCDMIFMSIPDDPETRPIRIKWDELCVGEEWVNVYSSK